MHRFWDLLPRAIRFKWKSTVPTLNKIQLASDQQLDHNDKSLLSPNVPRVCYHPEAQKTNIPSTPVLKLFTSAHKQNRDHDSNFYQRSFFLSRTFSVIGWGTVFTIGLQLNKHQWKFQNNSNNSESSWLQYITYALPLNKSSTGDIDQKTSHNSFTELKPEEFPLNKQEPGTFNDELTNVLENIMALHDNAQGINAAKNSNYKVAVEHWKKSSVLGYSKSCFNLGLCYELGNGVNKDLTKAMKYYQVAADNNHLQAMYNLALLQLDPQNCNEKSISLNGMNLLQRAAQLGLSEAQTYLGVIYVENKEADSNKAVEMFKAAAEQQDINAYYYLGICFETGYGVDLNKSKAAEFFMKAAENGHSEAQYCLANYYEHELGGLPKDKKLALELYQKSAKNGNKNAQDRLEEILKEDSNKPAETLKMSSKMLDLDLVKKVTQKTILFTSSFSSLFENSVMAFKPSFNNNNHLAEEQFGSYLQYMPHCCAKKDILVPLPKNTSEVLCS